ncbi:hypothetical protein BGZ65_012513, partial [Modicella reniformis]
MGTRHKNKKVGESSATAATTEPNEPREPERVEMPFSGGQIEINPDTATSRAINNEPPSRAASREPELDTATAELDCSMEDVTDIEIWCDRLKAQLEADRVELAYRQRQCIIETSLLLSLQQTPLDQVPNRDEHQQALVFRTQKVQDLQTLTKNIKDRAKATNDLLNTPLGEIDDAPATSPPTAQKLPPSHGIKLAPTYPRFKMGSSAHEFIESFRNNVLPTLSAADRKDRVPDYLICLVQNSDQQTALRTQLDALVKKERAEKPSQGEIEFEKIEAIFHGVCREPEEKKKFLNQLRYLDFEKKESYRQLAQRILGARKKVHKTECDPPIMARLADILPDHTLQTVNTHYF